MVLIKSAMRGLRLSLSLLEALTVSCRLTFLPLPLESDYIAHATCRLTPPRLRQNQSVGEVWLYLLAQPPLEADAVAVAHDQHPEA